MAQPDTEDELKMFTSLFIYTLPALPVSVHNTSEENANAGLVNVQRRNVGGRLAHPIVHGRRAARSHQTLCSLPAATAQGNAGTSAADPARNDVTRGRRAVYNAHIYTLARSPDSRRRTSVPCLRVCRPPDQFGRLASPPERQPAPIVRAPSLSRLSQLGKGGAQMVGRLRAFGSSSQCSGTANLGTQPCYILWAPHRYTAATEVRKLLLGRSIITISTDSPTQIFHYTNAVSEDARGLVYTLVEQIPITLTWLAKVKFD